MTNQPNLIITIARQVGAGGAELGQRLAKRLGIAYLDREILRLAAEQVGVKADSIAEWDERVSSFWERWVDSLAIGVPESMYTAMPVATVRDASVFDAEARVINEVADRRSAVIIGRAGFWVLRDRPGLVRLFVHAPMEARIPVVMRAVKLPTEKEARAAIQSMDRERSEFVDSVTGKNNVDANNYDLSINTALIGMDLAEELAMRVIDRVRAKLPASAPGATPASPIAP